MRSIARSRSALTVIGLVSAASLLLAGCGGSEDQSPTGGTTPVASAPASSSDDSATHNDADIGFAQMMIPHHVEAVTMAELAKTRAGDEEVKQLAAQITAEQEPEITTMTGWLKTWGEAVPDTASSGMGGMNQDMPGAMSAGEMKMLQSSSGAAFDDMFLTMMVKHHEGAITMAEEEQAKGANADAKALAGKIISAQQAEIVTMKGILARL